MPALRDEDGTLIAGHRRILAAGLLGLEAFPVARAAGWTEEEKNAYRIADNQLTLEGAWDDELLRAPMRELEAAGWDLTDLGFKAHEVDGILQDFPQDPAELWRGMPEFEHEDQRPAQKITVNFRTREDVLAFAGLLGVEVTDRTDTMWFPAEARTGRRGAAYASDQDDEP